MVYRVLPKDIKERMIALRAEGLKNEQIAESLGVSPMTVYNKIGSVKKYKPRKDAQIEREDPPVAQHE
jgi:transposase